MSVYFSIVTAPADLVIDNDVIRWHLDHGAVYNVHQVADGAITAPLGVVYLTVLCGLGAIVHFDTTCHITPDTFRSCTKKVTSFIAAAYPALFATIPDDKPRLIRFARTIGFAPLPGGSITADGTNYVLLKYLKPR